MYKLITYNLKNLNIAIITLNKTSNYNQAIVAVICFVQITMPTLDKENLPYIMSEFLWFH